MLRRVTAAAGSIGFLALSAAAEAQQPTANEMFRPVQGDLALVNLRKLLGCVVDGVWTAAACTDDRPLTVALGYFNVGCLIVATLLACYLLYSMVADTANDGQAFGRATSSRYTLLRVVTGAILALPIKSGLSLVQILVVQIAVWGSGFGDTLWTKVANTQLTGMYGSLSQPQPYDGDFVLRGKLAQIMESRLYGHVCAQALRQYAANVSGNPNAADIRATNNDYRTSWGSSGARETSYYFQDYNGYFFTSDDLCGSVKHEYVTINPRPSDPNDAAISATLISLAEQQSRTAFQTAIASLDASAATIAQSIVSGTRNNIAIKRQIKSAIDSAYSAANQNIVQTTSNTQLQSAIRNYLSNSTQNGWLSAALWQRSMSAVQAKIQSSSAATSANITIVPPAAISSYIPIFHRFNSAYGALADKAQRDLSYIAGFSGYFAAQGMGSVSEITSDTANNAYSAEGIIGKTAALIYSQIFKITNRPDTTTWKDPVIEAQEIGYAISTYSAGAGTVGAASSGISSWLVSGENPSDRAQTLAAVAGGVSTMMTFVTGLLFAAAFLLIGVVPFVILVHFLMAAFNWFLVIAEAMVAVPIWLLTKFMPARSDSFVGNSGQGYMFFLGILLRPALIVIGMLLALLLMRIGLDITNLFFRGALAMLSPDGSIATVFLAAAGIFAYALTMFVVITMAAGQISALPETVLGWIGGQIARRAGAGAGSNAAAIMLPSNPSSIGKSAVGRGATRLSLKTNRTVAGQLRSQLQKPTPPKNDSKG